MRGLGREWYRSHWVERNPDYRRDLSTGATEKVSEEKVSSWEANLVVSREIRDWNRRQIRDRIRVRDLTRFRGGCLRQ